MKPKLLTTLADYRRADFLADLGAGVTVAMVALPLSIAIAIASHATPAQGLVTAIVGGLLISLLGGSRVQIGGPTGAFIVVVAGIIDSHGMGGLLMATAMAAIILLVAGALRAGRLMAHVPLAVVEGFTVGIGIVIAASQLKDFLGLSIASVPSDFFPKVAALWAARTTLSPEALAIGAVSILLILGFRRAAPRLPGLIVAVAIASAAGLLLGLPIDTVGSRFGALPHGLPLPALPPFDLARVPELIGPALVIAFLAGIESLLSAMVADRITGGAHRPNAELLAQGAANLASACFGGLPATGAIARTATNVRAGGRTPVAGIVHALTILLVMAVAAPLAGHIAMPTLAGLLLVTAVTMMEPSRLPHHLRQRWPDVLLFVVTLVLTVAADLTVAVGTGIALGLILRRFAPPGRAPAETQPD